MTARQWFGLTLILGLALIAAGCDRAPEPAPASPAAQVTHPAPQGPPEDLASLARVEPLHWWAGFAEPRLQLMVYGANIAARAASVTGAGVALAGVQRTGNPNYLFLDLDLSQAAPGVAQLRFAGADGDDLTHAYEIKARREGSAQRRGFDSNDAIYLITPDRFANGDPSNDDVAGFLERADRTAPTGRHGGDLEGVRQQVDYIAGLGFTQIWLNPVLETNEPAISYHGYAMTDLYRIDPRMGDLALYKRLSAEAKAKGVGLIMDMVANHVGARHWWMRDKPTPDWINFGGDYVQTNHAHTVWMDPYASERDRRHFADGWFVRTMPDLNQRQPLLATYLIQNALWWIEEADLSGVRMDTWPYPDKYFMAQWAERIAREYPNFSVVGEEWHVKPDIVSYWQAGKANRDGYDGKLDVLMDFPLQAAMRAAMTEAENLYRGTGAIKLYEILASDLLYPNPMDLVVFGDNHDMDRLHTQLGKNPAATKAALSYVALIRGIPQIYYGTEILMANDRPNDHADIRRDMPGGWAGDAVSAFSGVGLGAEEAQMQADLRTLLRFRQSNSAVRTGKLTHFAPSPPPASGNAEATDQGVYVFFRHDQASTVMVALNVTDEPRRIDVSKYAEFVRPGDLFATPADPTSANPLPETISIGPRGSLVQVFAPRAP